MGGRNSPRLLRTAYPAAQSAAEISPPMAAQPVNSLPVALVPPVSDVPLLDSKQYTLIKPEAPAPAPLPASPDYLGEFRRQLDEYRGKLEGHQQNMHQRLTAQDAAIADHGQKLSAQLAELPSMVKREVDLGVKQYLGLKDSIPDAVRREVKACINDRVQACHEEVEGAIKIFREGDLKELRARVDALENKVPRDMGRDTLVDEPAQSVRETAPVRETPAKGMRWTKPAAAAFEAPDADDGDDDLRKAAGVGAKSVWRLVVGVGILVGILAGGIGLMLQGLASSHQESKEASRKMLSARQQAPDASSVQQELDASVPAAPKAAVTLPAPAKPAYVPAKKPVASDPPKGKSAPVQVAERPMVPAKQGVKVAKMATAKAVIPSAKKPAEGGRARQFETQLKNDQRFRDCVEAYKADPARYELRWSSELSLYSCIVKDMK